MAATVFSLYIVRCADDSLYTGIAADVAKRLAEHRCGSRGAKYLRGRQPLNLEFKQAVGDRAAALRLEHRVKQLSRKQKERLIRGRISLRDLLRNQGADAASDSGSGSDSGPIKGCT